MAQAWPVTFLVDFCPATLENMALTEIMGKDNRGWCMRHGHRRLADSDQSIMRGRASFARKVGKSKTRCDESPGLVAKSSSNKTSEVIQKTKKVARVRWKSEVAKDCRSELCPKADDDFNFAELPLARRWEEAEAMAALAAKAYVPVKARSKTNDAASETKAKEEKTPAQTGPAQTRPEPFLERPAFAGGPLDVVLHDQVLQFATAGSQGVPSCWQQKKVPEGRRQSLPSQSRIVRVDFDSSEYKAVTEYFKRTLCSDVHILELTRLVNQKAYHRYRAKGDETIMFHGCRSKTNEDSIKEHGFQVSKCFSGGPGFGTWLLMVLLTATAGMCTLTKMQCAICSSAWCHMNIRCLTMRPCGWWVRTVHILFGC